MFWIKKIIKIQCCCILCSKRNSTEVKDLLWILIRIVTGVTGLPFPKIFGGKWKASIIEIVEETNRATE